MEFASRPPIGLPAFLHRRSIRRRRGGVRAIPRLFSGQRFWLVCWLVTWLRFYHNLGSDGNFSIGCGMVVVMVLIAFASCIKLLAGTHAHGGGLRHRH